MFKFKKNSFLIKTSIVSCFLGISLPCMALPVTLKSNSGHYVVGENGGGSVVNANRARVGPWEIFDLRDLNGGSLRDGDKVCLITNNGHYMVAENGGGSVVNANRTACGPWEEFTIFRLDATRRLRSRGKIKSGDYIALKTNNGHYVVAENGGGSVVNANRRLIRRNGKYQLPGDWEVFQIYYR